MAPAPVILIFDVGKTNKKILLFDMDYRIVHEESVHLPEITDEDGFPCEDVHALSDWIRGSFKRLDENKNFNIRSINFSAYGASFVHVDASLKPLLPLYNYLKPYPDDLRKKFYSDHGGEKQLTKMTASPVLGSLNSGLQLYRLKYERPEAYKKIRHSLHLPQYVSSVLSGKAYSEITSIGCHTHLWDFTKNDYHEWVYREEIIKKFPPIVSQEVNGRRSKAGVGLHDSSAALIPYLKSFREPFILLSTGTWSISLNPFNKTLLTDEDLRLDCLCYLSFGGDPVKASRLFSGNEHDMQVKRIAGHFHTGSEQVIQTDLSHNELKDLRENLIRRIRDHQQGSGFYFRECELTGFHSPKTAYAELMTDLVVNQFASTGWVLVGSNVRTLFVDGGFSRNRIFMGLLATAFSGLNVYAATVPQASALGAAIVMHRQWNKNDLPKSLIEVEKYSAA